jgi:putative phosphoribosyl transferase
MRALFLDRREAGERLAEALAAYRGRDTLVLALPRGGVPVGFEIAQALGAELDILVVRKIGAPGHAEFGIGAIVDGAPPRTVLSQELVRHVGATPDYLAAVEDRERAELERRRALYRDGPFPELEGRIVIVADDGIATGGTMRAALTGLNGRGAARIIVAVPVAAADSLSDLSALADETVCVATPDYFEAVGAHYRNFDQTSDEEVLALLAEARAQRSKGSG